MKTINNKILNEFKIGYEFEFYVKNVSMLSPTPQGKVKTIPKDIMEKYGHLIEKKKISENKLDYKKSGAYLLKTLNSTFPEEDWTNSFKFVQDGSLNDKKGFTSVEAVFKHVNGIESQRKLKKILGILSTPDFLMDNSCGLHINVSFEDITKNHKDLVFEVAKLLDVNKIKTKFGRQKNEYCETNQDTSVDKYELRDTLNDKVFDLILGKSEYVKFNTFQNKIKELKKPANFVVFFSMIENILKGQFLETWEDERPAIAPKKNESENRYIEFRATGGKDYAKKSEDIIESMDSYLKTMIKAHNIIIKEKTKQKLYKIKMA